MTRIKVTLTVTTNMYRMLVFNTHDISRSTHLTSTTDNNMDTAGFTMSHGLNHVIITHGHYNDTTIGRLGYYKDTINQYDCMRIRVTIYDGSKDQGPTILIQVLHLRLVRPRMTVTEE